MNREKEITPGTILVNDRGWSSPIFITAVEGHRVFFYRMYDPDDIVCSMYLRANGYREIEEGEQLKIKNGSTLSG